MHGRRHSIQRGSMVGILVFKLVVNHRIVQTDDLAVHFYCVRDQHGVVVNPQHPLRQAGLAVSGGTVEEDRLLGDERRSQAVQQPVRNNQVRERVAQDFPVDVDLCCLILVAA